MSDLISRQVAIELIHSLYPSAPIMPMNRKRWEKKYKPYIEAEKALEMLPSAQPEWKKGKWLPENRTMDAFWVCSSCGFPSEAHAANILYHFCPNCGAKME